ncbi:MAG: FecR family protein [Verrucomicrobiales bacterium]|nr:FecR family protein [Verrucomicrobiales bacterium]
MNRDRAILFSKARDENLTRDELSQLERLLQSDPEARRDYLRFMQLHSLLENRPAEADEMAIEEALTDSKFIHLPRSAALTSLATAVVVAVAAVFGFQKLIPETSPHRDIATLLYAEDCQWGQSTSPVEGQRLSPGPVWLKNGVAVIRFDGGAEIFLNGDTKIQLESAGQAKLDHGDIVVRAEEGAEGFLLGTPSGEFIDLGTEFAVRTGTGGDTELHVHEGAVAVGSNVFKAGEAILFNKSKEVVNENVERKAPRFDEMVQRSKPRERRDLMIAYEGFFLNEGRYQPGEIQGGKGWAGPWRLRTPGEYGHHGPDTTKDMQIAYARMEMTWPIRGGKQGMLELPAGRNIRTRQLAKSIDLSGDGITYVSFLAADQRDGTADGKHSFRVSLRPSENYFGETLSIGWAKNGVPRVMTSSGQLRRSIRKIPANETVFCIAKITSRARGGDEIFFRFYRKEDSLDIFEPADWDIELRDFDYSASLDLLLLTSHGDSATLVDEIRIGPSWRSVTPLDEANR